MSGDALKERAAALMIGGMVGDISPDLQRLSLMLYRLLAEGDVSIHDDRDVSQPWGILGGKPGAVSKKFLIRKDGEKTPLPAKIDNVRVRPGDRIVFCTAGGGGWGDPLERDPIWVRNDVARKLVSIELAHSDYGVVLEGAEIVVAHRASQDLREGMRRNRKALPMFDFGDRRGSK